jgi:hypothetical protein
VQLVEKLHDLTIQFPAGILVEHLDNLVVAAGGQVSSTKLDQVLNHNWQVSVAAKAATWWSQNPNKLYEAATSSLV